MGCGASSLKGDDVPAVNSQPTTAASPPMKKIKTNFSTVDYDQDSQERRMTEYAPHETPKAKKTQDLTGAPSPQLGHADGQNDDLNASPSGRNTGTKASSSSQAPGTRSGAGHDEPVPTLEPYKTFDGGDWDEDATGRAPYVNGAEKAGDPTSTLAKDEFATENDPANPLNQETKEKIHRDQHHNKSSTASTDSPDGNRKSSSWLGQKYSSFQSAKKGTGVSDEDIKKYTGKDRSELAEWAKTAPGVAGNQGAGRPGHDSRLASSAPWTA